jgi:hypothetical protein
MLTEAEAKELLDELERIEKSKFELHSLAFPQQLAFIQDQSRLKALFCTRRAAKSFTGGLYLVETALRYPNSNCLFIGLTRQSAHGIIWKDILRELDRANALNIKFNETLLTATFPNGSVIWVTGADTDEQEMNKLLGKKYKLVVIDEASMFTINMPQLVYGVLKPATADQRGTICLLGTASNITRGLFYDITTNREPGWSLHTWTAFDNPHVRTQWQEELDEISLKRPLFKETPLFKQWYLNQWVVDEDALVYKYSRDRNRALQIPVSPSGLNRHYVLGIDLGHSPDPSAFVVSCYYDDSPTLTFVHAEKHLRMDVTDVANKIRELERIYTFDVRVIDNANKQAVAELNNRHDVKVIPADKTGKNDFINLMNAEMIQGKVKLWHECKELEEEWLTLVWETENGIIKLTPSGQRKEHPGLPNHLCDAALYNWRYCYQYLFKTPIPDPKWGSQEHWEPKHIEKLVQEIQVEKDPNHWKNVFIPDEGLFDFGEDDVI